MAQSEFLTYKGKPLVRKGKEIFYGNMSDKAVVRFEILSSHEQGKLEIADKVSVQLLDTDSDMEKNRKVLKESEKGNLFDALDLGFTWLERTLK